MATKRKKPKVQESDSESDESNEQNFVKANATRALGESIFSSPEKQEQMRKRRKEEEFCSRIFLLMLYISRVVHFTSSIITCSLIVLNFCFDNVLKDIPSL